METDAVPPVVISVLICIMTFLVLREVEPLMLFSSEATRRVMSICLALMAGLGANRLTIFLVRVMYQILALVVMASVVVLITGLWFGLVLLRLRTLNKNRGDKAI